MAERLLLLLSGGGALGAYECGVYRALVKEFGVAAVRSMTLVGASSGAINAAVIARHCGDDDGGAAALTRFWRELASPAVPFFPFPHPYWQRLNGALTGLVFGNPSVFYRVPGGALAALLAAPYATPYRTTPLRAKLAQWLSDYRSGPGRPRLLVRALDVEAAEPRWFDSDNEPITPDVVVGSSSIPLLFPPAWHDGRAYWDGSVWIESLLPETLRRVVGGDPDSRPHVVSVELVTPHGGRPLGLGGTFIHLRDMMLGTRFDRDLAQSPVAGAELSLTRVRRLPHAYERVSSGLFDWSPDRIDALIEQGERDATRAWAATAEAAQGRPTRSAFSGA